MTLTRKLQPVGATEDGAIADAFLNAAQVGMAILRLEDARDAGSLRVIRLNPAAARITNTPFGSAFGARLDAKFPAILQTDLPRRLADVARGGPATDLGEMPGVYEPQHVYQIKAFPLPPDCVGVVFDDVSERHRAVLRIEQNERQLARAQELAHFGSWSWDIGSDTITWSDELYRIYGLSPATFHATFPAFLDRVHPDDRTRVETAVRESLQRRTPFRYRERILRPDGEIRVLDSQGEVMLDTHGRPLQMVGLCRDVTDDDRAVRALQESEERFRKIFEASPVAICVLDVEDGRLVDVNPRFVELLGYGSRSAVIGKPVSSLGMWANEAEWPAVVENLRTVRSLREAKVVYRTYVGQARQALVALELLEIEGQQRVLGLFWRV